MGLTFIFVAALLLSSYSDANIKKDARGNLDDLEEDVEYNSAIIAQSVNGSSSSETIESIPSETYPNDVNETQVPDKPNRLRAKPTSNSIFVSWNPPKNQHTIIRGYTIGWGVGFPDVYIKVLDGKQRSYNIDNLQSSSEYVISLRAFNQVGDGQPIYETVKTMIESTPEPQLPMTPPVGLRAVVLSASTVVLYWTDTSLPRQQIIADNRFYTVRYTSYVHSNNPKYRYFNSTELNCMIDDLKPNTQYEFAVKVVKGRRESTWSMSVLNMTQEAAPTSPPRDLTVVPSTTSDDPTIIHLHWQPPKTPNGQITGYIIFYTTDNTQRDRDWVVEGVIGDKMTTILKGLLPDTTYYFKIQARNNKGYGPLSQEVSFKTLPALPGSIGASLSEGKHISTNTLYIIIAAISGITVLLLVVVSTLLCRSRNSASGGYIGGMRKSKGYIAAATSPGKTGGHSGKGKGINPPDLWIHHDQMELKALEKGNSSETTMTVTPIPRNSQELAQHDEDVLDKFKKTTSTYGGDSLYDDINKGSTSPSDTSITIMSGTSTARRTGRAKPIVIPVHHSTPQTVSMQQPNGNVNLEPSTGLSRPLYPRTQFNTPRAHVTLDADNNASRLHHMHHHHHLYDPVASPPMHMGVGGSAVMGTGQVSSNASYSSTNSSPQVIPVDGSSPNTVGKRPLGHPLKSFSVPAPPPNATGSTTPQPKHIAVRPQLISSPNKKPGGIPASNVGVSNPMQKIGNSSARGSATDNLRREQLLPSYSTEELNQEMANLEGLMKDLNAITASEFEC